MNTLSMRTFLTRERYVELSNLPPSMEEAVFARLRHKTDKHGNATYEEADIDASVDHELGRCTATPVTPPQVKPGRKPTNRDAVIFAKHLHDTGVCWKDVRKEVNARYGTRYKNAHAIRVAVSRLYKAGAPRL